jgi:hypothetical protein
MASFYAELHIEGHSYPVRQCNFASRQATDARGRMQSKVRHEPLLLLLDVPDDEVLLNWAATPLKALAGQVVFYETFQRVARETLSFTAGHCVQYSETFESGNGGAGAYQCELTITATEFDLRAGGPAASKPTSAARHMMAAVPSALTSARETSPGRSLAAAGLANMARTVAETTISAGLARMLDTVLLVAPTAGPDGPANFAAATKADLQAIYDTPTGRQMLDSLAASGRRIYINYGQENRAGFPYNGAPAFFEADGITPGQGLAMSIEYNPLATKTGAMPWNERPPAIGLAHELVHAEQAAYGRMRREIVPNPGGPDPANPDKQDPTNAFELEAVGVPPYDTYPVSENKIRAEWNPPQTRRAYY